MGAADCQPADDQRYRITTLPLNRSFLIFGHATLWTICVSNWSTTGSAKAHHAHDAESPGYRLCSPGQRRRAGAAGDELAKYPTPRISKPCDLVDEHGDDYWNSTLYTGWLGRCARSHGRGGTTPAGSELPSIALTEGWGGG